MQLSLNKYFFIFIFLIIGISNIYAARVACWTAIECDHIETPSGSIFSLDPEVEITCVIKELTYAFSTEDIVEIEILQPGYNGATLQQQILVTESLLNNNGQEINFILGRGTSPTYVNCYDVVTTINGALTRRSSLKHWSSSFDNTWFSTIDPHPTPNKWLSNNSLTYNPTGTFNVNAVTTATIKDTNIIKTYENLKSDETNWFFYGVGLFMFIIGLLLIFTTVIAYTKRR